MSYWNSPFFLGCFSSLYNSAQSLPAHSPCLLCKRHPNALTQSFWAYSWKTTMYNNTCPFGINDIIMNLKCDIALLMVFSQSWWSLFCIKIIYLNSIEHLSFGQVNSKLGNLDALSCNTENSQDKCSIKRIFWTSRLRHCNAIILMAKKRS